MALSGQIGETPWLDTLFGRQFQYYVLDIVARLEWWLIGPGLPRVRASGEFRKSLWRDGPRGVSTWLKKVLSPPEPPREPRPNDPGDFDAWALQYLAQDWNKVYQEIGETGTFLGYLAGYLSNNLRLPEERIRTLSLDEVSFALHHKLGADLQASRPDLVAAMNDGTEDIPPMAAPGNPGLDPERAAALAYANREGSKWIAIYQTDPETGEEVRGGRPYEIVSRLFRQQISEAIEKGETPEQLRSRMVFPDLLSLYESGEISEDEYQDWSRRYLNRDFERFALTEASFAWSAGRKIHAAEYGRSTGQPQYLQFSLSGGRAL